MNRPRPTIFVTVGMGPWPFDRLVRALPALTADFDVFAQVGTTSVVPPCAHADFIGSGEFQRRLAEADIVVTHAGNTVRHVQRLGKVPIAAARISSLGEMANDHQLRFLEAERDVSPLVVVEGDPLDLVVAVETHLRTAHWLVEERAVPPRTDASTVRRRLAPLARDQPILRHSWVFAQLADLDGLHLELGCGTSQLTKEFNGRTGRLVVRADPSPEPVATLVGCPGTSVRIGARDPLPFASGVFASVSILHTLEHVLDDSAVIDEVARVMGPGAELIICGHLRHVRPRDTARFHARVVELSRGRLVVHTLDVASLAERFGDLVGPLIPNRFRARTHSFALNAVRRSKQANLYLVASKPV